MLSNKLKIIVLSTHTNRKRTTFEYNEKCMSDKYRIRDNDKPYYITTTTVGWIDVFTRLNHKKVIIDSLNYCVKNKGLIIYAWCLMSNHLHMICQ